MHDLIIVGAGPAGLGAAIYASINKLKTLVLAKEFSKVGHDDLDANILTYRQLLESFKRELGRPKGCIEFKEKQEVIAVEKNVVSFSAETKSSQILYSKAMVLAYGKNLEFGLENMTAKDLKGRVKVDPEQKTSVEGIFAAGHCAAGGMKDELVCAAEGAKAVFSAVNFIKSP